MLKNRRKKRSREQRENWRATWRENKSIAEAKEKLEDKNPCQYHTKNDKQQENSRDQPTSRLPGFS